MKSTITPEIILTLKNDLLENRGKLEQLKMEGYFNVSVGMVRIVATPTEMYLNLGEGIGSKYLKDWNLDVGKLMADTLKKKRFELIYIYETDTYTAVLRKCPDEDLEKVKESKFDHLYIGDNVYTIIRVVSINGSYALYDRRGFDPDEYVIEEEEDNGYEEPSTTSNKDLGGFESLSLFED